MLVKGYMLWITFLKGLKRGKKYNKWQWIPQYFIANNKSPVLQKKQNLNVIIFWDAGSWRLHLAPGQLVFWETYCPQSVSTQRHDLLCVVIPLDRINVAFVRFPCRKPLQQETCQWMLEMPPSLSHIPDTPEPDSLSTSYSAFTSG